MNDSTSLYLEKQFGLHGKTAVLIGAAGLLVGEISIGLSLASANVILLDVNNEGLHHVAELITKQGGNATIIQADVTQKIDLEKALSQILQNHPTIDILVNGSGSNAPTPFFDISLDEWNKILNVQLTGTMLSCQVFGQQMVKQKSGSIINISSASAGPPLSKAFTYSVAKSGVLNLTQNLAREWATLGVRANILRPGFFPSEFMKKNFLTEERIAAILNHTPMKRFGDAKELVGACIWLSSDAASFVTGAVITVDGGFTAMTI